MVQLAVELFKSKNQHFQTESAQCSNAFVLPAHELSHERISVCHVELVYGTGETDRLLDLSW